MCASSMNTVQYDTILTVNTVVIKWIMDLRKCNTCESATRATLAEQDPVINAVQVSLVARLHEYTGGAGGLWLQMTNVRPFYYF